MLYTRKLPAAACLLRGILERLRQRQSHLEDHQQDLESIQCEVLEIQLQYSGFPLSRQHVRLNSRVQLPPLGIGSILKHTKQLVVTSAMKVAKT